MTIGAPDQKGLLRLPNRLRALTLQHPDVAKERRGRFLGVSAPPLLEHFRSLGSTTVELQLMRAAQVVRGEVFDATPGKHCDHCQFHSGCPTKAAGTVLS